MADRRLPPLYPLRAFEATARRMSFTLAAEELSISQSAVSHQVKTLEAYFGVSLFNRTRSALRLTAEGKRLFNACEAAFTHLAQISNDLPDSELRGTITLISPPLVFNWWLLPKLRPFRERYPNIRFRFLHGVCGARMMPTDADIALIWDTQISEGFVGAAMFNMLYAPVASPRLAASLPEKFCQAVTENTVLLHENDHDAWTKWLRDGGHNDVSSTSGWVFEDPGMMIEAAAAGEGIALAPFPLLDDLVGSGRLVKIFGRSSDSPNKYFLALSQRSVDKPGIRLFWNWFTQYGLPTFPEILHSR